MAKLIITEGGRDKIFEIADSEFTVGGSEDADLQLRDPGAAPLHLTVKKTPAGFQIIDLETKSGTRVNGKMANQHVLSNGDTIQIGDAKITFIGKGPTRAAPRPAGAPGMRVGEGASRRVYRREKSDQKMSMASQVTLLLSGIVLLIGFGYWVLDAASPGINEYPLADKEVRYAIKETYPEEKIRELMAHAKKMRDSTDDKKQFTKLEKFVKERLTFRQDIGRGKVAAQSLITLRNMRKTQPNNVGGFMAKANEWLGKFDDLNTAGEAWLREHMANLDGEVSPEQRRFGALEEKVQTLVGAAVGRVVWKPSCSCKPFKRPNRRFREALEVISSADNDLKALYAEELAAMALNIRKKSRAAVTIRKNDVRHEIRLGHPSEARVQVADMFDKLALETIEAYLEFPDGGYQNPDTARFELETQTLLKAGMKLAKQR